MEKPKIDIYKTLIVNRMVVWGLTIAFIVSSAIFAFSINDLYSRQLNTVLVLDSGGEVIPMKWMQRDENIKVEIKDHLEKFRNVGNGVEIIINDIHTSKRVKTIKLPHVYILSKVEKVAVPEAMIQYVKEAGQFLKAIVAIQTNDLTPQAKKVFRVAQSYIKLALTYLQSS